MKSERLNYFLFIVSILFPVAFFITSALCKAASEFEPEVLSPLVKEMHLDAYLKTSWARAEFRQLTRFLLEEHKDSLAQI